MAGILLSLGLWLFGRRHYLYVWLALAAIWFYTLVTGMHPPVIRGAVMASMFLIAELLGRQRTAITSLAFAAAAMVAFSPLILWQVSFQLSFLAMAGLIFIFPRLRSAGRRAVSSIWGEKGAAASIASVTADGLGITLAAILATWPVVAHYFGVVSLVGPLATLLALPALPAIIITSVLAGGLGLVALPLAQAVGWLAWLFLSYLLLVVNVFAALPASVVYIDKVDGGQYLEVLEKATDVEDILNVYQRLSEVRREIEQLKGRMQYLERLTSMSLISVSLRPEVSDRPMATAGWSALEILKEAVRGIITFGQWLVTALIWVVIFIPVWGGIIGFIYWRLRKRRAAS